MSKFFSVFRAISTYLEKFPRAKVIADKSAWLLIAPVVAALYLIDPIMAKTLGQWSVVNFAFAGAAVIISRIVLPQINLSELIDDVREGNTAAGIVAAAVIGFTGLLFLGLVLWGKA